jgi:hypothetical protein
MHSAIASVLPSLFGGFFYQRDDIWAVDGDDVRHRPFDFYEHNDTSSNAACNLRGQPLQRTRDRSGFSRARFVRLGLAGLFWGGRALATDETGVSSVWRFPGARRTQRRSRPTRQRGLQCRAALRAARTSLHVSSL